MKQTYILNSLRFLSVMLTTCSSTTQRNLLLKGKHNTGIKQRMFKNYFFIFTHSLHRKCSTQKLLNHAEIYYMSCTNCLCNKSLFRNFKNCQFRHHVTNFPSNFQHGHPNTKSVRICWVHSEMNQWRRPLFPIMWTFDRNLLPQV